METSAKEMVNVNETFVTLAAQLKNLADLKDQRLFEEQRKRNSGTIRLFRRNFYDELPSDTSAVMFSSDYCPRYSNRKRPDANCKGSPSKCT